MSLTLSIFGFHSSYFPASESLNLETHQKVLHNITNIAGYFPFTSVISGIARIAFSAYQMKTQNLEPDVVSAHLVNIGRGIGEILGFGKILFALDLIATIGRAVEAYQCRKGAIV